MWCSKVWNKRGAGSANHRGECMSRYYNRE